MIHTAIPYFLNETDTTYINNIRSSSLIEWNDLNFLNNYFNDDNDENTSKKKSQFVEYTNLTTPGLDINNYFKLNDKLVIKNDNYTLAGRNEQQMRQFSKLCFPGTFLTQYKIRENYKFLQMISVPPLDPAVPKPEGGVSVPACGEPLVVPASFPQSIEAAIHKFANASSKATCISVLDQFGKPLNSITYGIYFNFLSILNSN